MRLQEHCAKVRARCAETAVVRTGLSTYAKAHAWYVALCERWQAGLKTVVMRGDRCLRDARGQGTTEYAILVGVLVVIAIIAVVAFRGKLQELWGNISDGINGL
jgi:Flp pilus assembly pilin Flp